MVEKRGLAKPRREVAARLDSVGWALFFIWVGLALLLDLGLGIGLLGVGVIVLGGQAARRSFGFRLEGFWALLGAFFLLGGIWELFDITLPLLPVLLIGVGVAVFLGALGDRHMASRSHG